MKQNGERSHLTPTQRRRLNDPALYPANVTLATVADGRVRLERLRSSGIISARAWIQGKDIRKSTGERTLEAAKRVALEWWEDLRARDRMGIKIHSLTFADCAEKFVAAQKNRAARGLISDGQARNYEQKWSVLKPLFVGIKATDVDAEFLESVRDRRSKLESKTGHALTASTMKKDFIFVLGVMKHAKDVLKVIDEVPQTPSFTGTFSIQRRGIPFLTDSEYRLLHQTAKDQIDEEGIPPRTRRQREELYRFILICVGGALRVGEAESVRWCDCAVKTLKLENGKTQEAVRMMVLGKHSRGATREEAWVMFGGVFAFKEMLKARSADSKPEDPIFTESHREGMKLLLKRCQLYTYRDHATGETLTRSRKSLRPTAITMRLDRGDNLTYREIAKWCRTSVAMVQDFYDQAHPSSTAARVATFRKKPEDKSDAANR